MVVLGVLSTEQQLPQYNCIASIEHEYYDILSSKQWFFDVSTNGKEYKTVRRGKIGNRKCTMKL